MRLVLLPLLVASALSQVSPAVAADKTKHHAAVPVTPAAAVTTSAEVTQTLSKLTVVALIGDQAMVALPMNVNDASPITITIRDKEPFVMAGRLLYPVIEQGQLKVFLAEGRPDAATFQELVRNSSPVFSGTVAVNSGNRRPGELGGSGAWVVKSGDFLKDTLAEWVTKAGWSLVWSLGEREDFRVNTGDVYESDFKTAVHSLFDSLPPTVRIRAELRPDNDPPLLYVTRDEGGR